MVKLKKLVIEGQYATLSGKRYGQITIENGKITKIRKKGCEKPDIKTKGIIFPGFIDIHCHLREPGQKHKEDMKTGSIAALHGGVTLACDMPNNHPLPCISEGTLREKIELSKKSDIEIMFYIGLRKEEQDLAFLKDEELIKKVCGFKIYTYEFNDYKQIDKKIKQAKRYGLPFSFHCEDKKTLEVNARFWDPKAAWTHYSARPKLAEIVAVKEAVKIIKKHKIKGIICHASTEQTIDHLVEERVMFEQTPHHAMFTKDDVKDNFLKVNPPLRNEVDRQTVISTFKKGLATFLSTDHAPHTLEEKQGKNPPSGVPGIESYAGFVGHLYKNGVSTENLVRMTSYNQAKLLRLKKGLIKIGYDADLVIINFDKETEYMEPKTKCGWLPYKKLPARVEKVIISGKIIL